MPKKIAKVEEPQVFQYEIVPGLQYLVGYYVLVHYGPKTKPKPRLFDCQTDEEIKLVDNNLPDSLKRKLSKATEYYNKMVKKMENQTKKPELPPLRKFFGLYNGKIIAVSDVESALAVPGNTDTQYYTVVTEYPSYVKTREFPNVIKGSDPYKDAAEYRLRKIWKMGRQY